MGSMKSQSLRYEVLVCPQNPIVQTKKVMASSNSVQPFLTQTKVRRFTIDENMQQYWIPDGFHPVLVPRPLIQSSIAANSHQTAISAGNEFNNINVCPLQTTSNTFGGNVTHRTKRRRLLGSQQDQMMATSPPSKVSLITFYAASIYYKQKCKELIASGIISNPPSEPPSKIIGKMWYEEPESTRKYYERLVLRLRTLKCEIDNNKKLGRRPPYKHQINPNFRHESRVAKHRSQRKQYHRSNLPYNENPIKKPSEALDISNKHHNESNVDTSSEDFTKCQITSNNNKNVSNTEGGDCNSSSMDKSFEHQFSIMTNADDLCRESFIISSSPKLSANRINNNNVNDTHNADWMTRSNDADY
ncbi:hypothetical protein Glove_158g104 [Diversispora epigaea]|uniref:Uncharacterized protein n=1 Tax=Diversispora epigaea TaxID=1348612 RepID=A0A397IRK4_9GLOM|nr:hypothetical protein Glove_158g104 [Diversispora epigaea]